MWATADTEIDFPISYLVEDDFVIPSTASATIRDVQGAVVLQPTALDVSTTSAILQIPADVTSIPPGTQHRTLFVNIRFVANGQLHERRHHLYLVPFIPLTVTEETVRQVLGLPVTDLSDREIRIYPAYFRLLADAPAIEAALASGMNAALRANRAIAIEAALELVPSLALRVAQKMKSEDQEFSRFNNIDWNALTMSLEGELADLLDHINNVAEVPTVSHFSWANPTDPITGG